MINFTAREPEKPFCTSTFRAVLRGGRIPSAGGAPGRGLTTPWMGGGMEPDAGGRMPLSPGEMFAAGQPILFVGAGRNRGAGRSRAPGERQRLTDPAVLVMDGRDRRSIFIRPSVGGANEASPSDRRTLLCAGDHCSHGREPGFAVDVVCTAKSSPNHLHPGPKESSQHE